MKSRFSIILFSLIAVFFFINFSVSINEKSSTTSSDLNEVVVDYSLQNEDVQCSRSIDFGVESAFASSDPGYDDGDDEGCDAISCRSSSPCIGGLGCTYTEVCDGCGCTFEQIGSYQGSGRCGD